jgi:hypothetical protein
VASLARPYVFDVEVLLRVEEEQFLLPHHHQGGVVFLLNDSVGVDGRLHFLLRLGIAKRPCECFSRAGKLVSVPSC